MFYAARRTWELVPLADIDCKRKQWWSGGQDRAFSPMKTIAVLPAQEDFRGWLVETEARPLSASLSRFARKDTGTDLVTCLVWEKHCCLDYILITENQIWEEGGTFTGLWDKTTGRYLRKRSNILRIYER